MEIMKLDGFLAQQASKLINKGLASKFGFNPDIIINKFCFQSLEDGSVRVELNAIMEQSDFEKLITEVTK